MKPSVEARLRELANEANEARLKAMECPVIMVILR